MIRSRFSAVTAAVVLFSAGAQTVPAAKRRVAGKTAAGLGSLRVSSQPAELRAARALAAKQAAANRNEEDDDLLLQATADPEAFEQLRREEARLAPLLRKQLAARNPKEPWLRSRAAFLLVRLQDTAGMEAVRRLLEDPAEAEVALALAMELPAADRAKLGDLEPVVLRGLEAQAEPLRRNALTAAIRLSTPATTAKALEVIGAGGDPRGRAAWGLARTHPSRELLELCTRTLQTAQPDDRYWWLMAAAELVRSPEPQLSAAAEILCVEALRRSNDSLGIDGASIAALEALEKSPSRYTGQFLSMLARAQSASRYVRGGALQGLAHRDPAAGRALALRFLSDPELDQAAVGALGEAGRGTADPQLVETLTRAAERRRDNRAFVGEVARALLSIGGAPALQAAGALADRLAPADRTAIRWAEQGTTRETALDRLVTLQVLDERTAALVRKKPTAPPPEARDADLGTETITTGLPERPDTAPSTDFLETVFEAAGRLTSFDTETGELPVRHDRLLLQLAKHSGGAFKPEATHQRRPLRSEEDTNTPYAVQFIHAGRLYRFSARNLEDWYDVPAVLTAANRALADAGDTRRFVALGRDSQDAAIAFVNPKALAVAAKELSLPGTVDPDSARRAGQAFEKGMVESIRKRK